MKDPERLKSQGQDAARLIEAMRRERPSDDQMQRALSLANDVASMPAASSVRWFARSSTWLGLSLAGTVLVGVVATSGSWFSREPKANRPTTPSSVTAPVDRAETRPALVVHEMPAEATVRVDDLPSAPPPNQARKAAPAKTAAAEAPAPASVSTTNFDDELALASSARSALGKGDPAACLDAVSQYRTKFPNGVFAQEVAVIRIEALAASGSNDLARTEAERFLASNQASPYAGRVRTVLEKTKR